MRCHPDICLYTSPWKSGERTIGKTQPTLSDIIIYIWTILKMDFYFFLVAIKCKTKRKQEQASCLLQPSWYSWRWLANRRRTGHLRSRLSTKANFTGLGWWRLCKMHSKSLPWPKWTSLWYFRTMFWWYWSWWFSRSRELRLLWTGRGESRLYVCIL